MAIVQKNLLKLALVVDPRTKDGLVFNDSSSAVTISTATAVNPSVITTATAHGYSTGDKVTILAVATNTAVNNTVSNPYWQITVTGATTFTVPVLGNGSGTGGTVTRALIGSVDGAKLPRQRLLDIYNQARMALFQAIDATYSLSEKITSISGTIVKKTDLQFSGGIATIPTGYIKAVYLTDVSGNQITISPFTFYRRTKDLYSTTNRMVYEYSTTLEAPTTSTTIMPNLSTYILRYFGITDFSISDVLGGSVTETFNDQYHSAILELAQAIFNEQGGKEVNDLALKLIGAK